MTPQHGGVGWAGSVDAVTEARPLDTVKNAEQSPDVGQPWAELGLKSDEYAQLREILGRRPTSVRARDVLGDVERALLLQVQQGASAPVRREGDRPRCGRSCMVGIGENAGVVDIGDGYAVTFKVESHNHPSYIEPYQGAATGVGGIVRDILSMGARPVAVMDSLRFGSARRPDTQRVVPGIVAGVGGYGNCLGLPNIGGETVFDPSYGGNPLVNALCVGVMRHEQIHLAKASGLKATWSCCTAPGPVVTGSAACPCSRRRPSTRKVQRSGRASRSATRSWRSCSSSARSSSSTPELVAGIQDLGGAGLSCATSELASAGDGGMHVWLDRVPLRDPSLAPEEILMSESQERMMAVVEPAHVDAFLAICAKWEVDATVIGEVTTTGRLVIEWHGETIVDVPPRTVAHEGPVYRASAGPARRAGRPASRTRTTAAGLTRPTGGTELRATLLRSGASANLCDRSWITDQYDRYVRGNTVLAQPEDAGVIRVDDETGLGVALALDCNARFTRLDPYAASSWRSRRLIATSPCPRRAADRRHRLPELRLAGGPWRDVAVRRGDPRAGRRMPRRSASR